MHRDKSRHGAGLTRAAQPILGLCGALLLIVLLVQPAWAIPPAAHTFWGTVKLSGQNVPNGTLVAAYIMVGGQRVICGSTQAFTPAPPYPQDSVYAMTVNGDDPDTPGKEGPLEGETLSFLIGEIRANETAQWHSAMTTNLNLSGAGGATATATATSIAPTATRTATPVFTPTPTPTYTATPLVSPTATRTPTNTLLPSATPTPTATLGATATATATPSLMTVTLRQGEGSYAGVMDTYLDAGNAGKNYGTSASLYVKTIDNVTALIRFDVAPPWLPAGAQISSATLRLDYVSRTPANPITPLTLRVFRVLKPWSETEANWAQASAALAWTRAGCAEPDQDYASAADDELLCYGDVASPPDLILDVTSAAQYWMDHPDANYGVVVKADSCRTLTALYQFSSSNQSTVALRPALTLNYFVPQPTATPTQTGTATRTPTQTPSPTATGTITSTPTRTGTPTQTPTITRTPSITVTPSATVTVGAIRGVVFYDLDADGEREAGEPPVGGVELRLYRDGAPLATYTTMGDGLYQFTDLAQGAYALMQTDVPGYVSTTGANWVLPVLAGHTQVIDFGLWLVPTPTPTATWRRLTLPLTMKQF